jgi:hypothetical protein
MAKGVGWSESSSKPAADESGMDRRVGRDVLPPVAKPINYERNADTARLVMPELKTTPSVTSIECQQMKASSSICANHGLRFKQFQIRNVLTTKHKQTVYFCHNLGKHASHERRLLAIHEERAGRPAGGQQRHRGHPAPALLRRQEPGVYGQVGPDVAGVHAVDAQFRTLE